MLFLLPEGHFLTVNLGTNAFLSIQTVNMTPGAPNQTVLLLTWAAEAQLLLSPDQVFSRPPFASAQTARTTWCMHQCIWLTPIGVFAAAQPVKATNVCRFFPECKKVDCQFYHPKVRLDLISSDNVSKAPCFKDFILDSIWILSTGLSLCCHVQTSQLHLLPPEHICASTACPEMDKSAEQVSITHEYSCQYFSLEAQGLHSVLSICLLFFS